MCSGDEDRATQGLRRRALSRAQATAQDVIVDLRELTFADASLMVDLAMLARRLRTEGHELLLRGPCPHVRRLIEITGLASLDGIRLEHGDPHALGGAAPEPGECATRGTPIHALERVGGRSCHADPERMHVATFVAQATPPAGPSPPA